MSKHTHRDKSRTESPILSLPRASLPIGILREREREREPMAIEYSTRLLPVALYVYICAARIRAARALRNRNDLTCEWVGTSPCISPVITRASAELGKKKARRRAIASFSSGKFAGKIHCVFSLCAYSAAV